MIQTLRIQQFRSYQDASFEFEPGVNIIVGPNASGKTNLLEAILVVSHGGSYRAKDDDLIQHHKEWARLDALIDDTQTRVFKISQNKTPNKEFVLNNTSRKRLRYEDVLPVVLFEPNHLILLTKSPELRRAYLDETISQSVPEYNTLLKSYKRALAQRNNLLKQPHVAADMYFVWNVRLSEVGAHIVRLRKQFVDQHAHQINNYYNEIVDTNHTVTTTYHSQLPNDTYSEAMLRELESRLATDRQRGFTSIGPHRDDLHISIDSKPISASASRGETRTIVLALKLVELTVIEQARNQKPILLLDDVFSELDGARRKNLTKHLRNYQSFITTTDADIVVQHFSDDANIIAMG